MMKHARAFTALTFFFSLASAQAQMLSCSLSDSETGYDNQSVTASITDFSCVDTVTNSFITEITMDAAIGSSFSSVCPGYYDLDLNVNGSFISGGLCSGTFNLSEYVDDLNSVNSVSIVSNDNDGSDYITVELDLDVQYLITDCPPPSMLAMSNIMSSTAVFSWTEGGSEIIWDVELVDITAGDTATGTPTNYGVLADSIELTGLAVDNMYEVYVRAYCGTGTDTESMWVGPIAFETEPTCYPVAGNAVTDILDVSALASWSSDETGWEIELINITAGDFFTGTPTILAIADTSYQFTGLLPENSYSYKVRSNCGPIDGNSVWSSVVSFTTDPSCLAPTNITITSLTDSSVTVSWVSNDTESQWGIELINISNGEVAGSVSDYTSTDTTFTIEGLDANTTYELFVNAECLVSDFSDWTSSGEFTTLCLPFAMPYVDSLNTWPTDCYTLSNSGTSNNWQTYTGTPGVIEVDFWNFSSGTVVFETGVISITEEAKLEFVWSSRSGTYSDQVSVYYTIDEGITWNQIWSRSSSQLSSNDGALNESPGSFITTEVLLPTSTIGESLRIKFEGVSGYGPNFFMDQLSVLPLPDCNIAYNLEVDTVLATEATFSFYDIVGDNSLSWNYTITSFSDTINGNTTVNPFTVTGLEPGKNYDIVVSTICSTDTTGNTSVVSFETPCSPLASFEEGFEAYGSGDLPLCWEEIEEATSIYADVEVNTSNGFNSSNSMQFYNSTSSTDATTHVIAITPELLNISDNWLKFRHRTSDSGNQKITVGYMTDYSDESTFVGLDTFDITLNAWNEANFIPSDYPAFTGNKIAIKGLFDGNYINIFMDDVVWETIPECYYPNDVVIDSANTNTVFASIDPYNATDAVWEIELVNLSTGESFTGTPTDTVTTSIFFIDGLEHSSEYEMYVRTNCGTVSSIWSSPYTFSTECSAVTDFVQGFEIGTLCWSLNNISTSTGSINGLITNIVNSGDNANELYNSSSSDPNQTFIATVTPELSNIAAGTHWIKFEARRYSSFSSTGNIELGTMSDPTDSSTYTPLTTFNITNSFSEYHYSFVEYTGTDAYVAIRLLVDGSYRDIVIDDIVWEEAPECGTPEGVTGLDIQDITAEIDWNPISVDSAWYIELVDLSNGGSQTEIATDSTVSHPFTLTGLTQNTNYAVYVRANCDTNWSAPYLFTTLISNDLEVSNFISPMSNGCQLSTAEEVVVNITNNGAQDATGFDVYYSFDGINFINDGVFTGTLSANSDTAYTLNTTFDFTTADDTNLFVVTDLLSDTINVINDTNSYFISNLGDAVVQLEINTGNFASETYWFIKDTLSGNTVAGHASVSPVGGEYSNYTTYTYDVCVSVGSTYSMEAWDSYGDGWNGGVYSVTQCGGVLIVNNDGLSPSTAPNNQSNQLEAQEYFTVEECDDYDLGIIMMDSIYSTCGMTATEQGYLLVQNFGLMDITSAMNVSVEYQVNGSGWANLATLTDLESGADTLLALPTVDMTTPLTYTFEYQIIYALDENPLNDSLELDIESVDTYTEAEQDFDDAPSGWTAHISSGPVLSWEWGIPTTTMISNGVDGSAWVTRLHDNMFLNEESYLLSPCFDFSGYTNDVEYAFDFIWTSTSTSNSVRFQVSKDGGQTWLTSTGNNILMPINTNVWTLRTGLLDLAGEGDVKFRFFMDNSYSTDAEGFGLDNFQVFEHVPYTDTTLVDLKVDGNTIPGFDPSVFTYTYEVSYGTTTVPVVDATVNAPFYESMDITQAPSIPGSATVVVTAEDTNFTGTYTVNFTEAAPSTNAYLSDISHNVTGTLATITGFDSLVFVYNETLPFGSALPPVTSTTSDTTATSVQTNSGGAPGFVTIVVTAQDGITTNTYVVNYDVEPADSISTLSDLTVGGSPVPGFDPDTLEYTVAVTSFPTTVDYTTSSTLATSTISPVGPYSSATTVVVTVTAQDGSSTEYTVHLIAPLSNDATLSDLSYEDGGSFVTVPGFDPNTLVYTIELGFGSSIPDVQYTTTDAGAGTVMTNSGTTVPGTTTVTVTAADGTTLSYTINWTQSAANDNARLASIVFGTGTQGVLMDLSYNIVTFNPSVTEYIYYVDNLIDASQLPPITSKIPEDPNASAVQTASPTQYNTPTTNFPYYEVTVTAQDSVTQKVYTFNPINGVGNNELEAGSISMYPNPSTGIVNVEVMENISDYSIVVMSATGQKVFFSEYVNDNAQNTIDLSSVADGIYYVIVRDTQSGKFAREKISIVK